MEGCLDKEKDPRRHVYKCYTVLFRELDLDFNTIDPVLYIPRYVSDLGLEEELVGLSIVFLQKYLPSINTNGKNPKGIAAAALYIVCCIYKYRVFQAKVAKIAGICDVTLRSRIKEFYAVFSQ